MRQQKVPNRIGAIFRKLLVVLVASNAVGITLYLNLQARIRLQNPGDLRQADLRTWFQRVLAGIEQHVGHIHNQPTRRFTGGKDAIELSPKLLTDGVSVRSALIGGCGSSLGLGCCGLGACAVGIGLRLRCTSSFRGKRGLLGL